MAEMNPFMKARFSVRDEFGKLIETTDEEEAKKEGIFNPEAKYGSSLIILEDKRLIKGFRDALQNAKIGEQQEVKIPKSEGFGERRQELVVLIPQKKFEEAKLSPQVGMVVDLDGQRGRVLSISGGRVQVDLNHELAGKDVVYKFKVLERIEEKVAKVNALLEEQLDASIKANSTPEGVQIVAPQETMKRENYLQGKYSIIQAALQFIPEIGKIQWTEEFSK